MFGHATFSRQRSNDSSVEISHCKGKFQTKQYLIHFDKCHQVFRFFTLSFHTEVKNILNLVKQKSRYKSSALSTCIHRVSIFSFQQSIFCYWNSIKEKTSAAVPKTEIFWSPRGIIFHQFLLITQNAFKGTENAAIHGKYGSKSCLCQCT